MITVPLYMEIVPGLPESQARRQLRNSLILDKSNKEALMCQADVMKMQATTDGKLRGLNLVPLAGRRGTRSARRVGLYGPGPASVVD